jgi:hypothetical protein
MSVANFFEKNFYPWAKVILVSSKTKEVLYDGEVGNCKDYLSNKITPCKLNFANNVTTIEVII